MPPRLRPCALHLSNHLVVQELLLHAALSRQHFTPGDRQEYLKLAKHIAQLPDACAPFGAQRPSRRGFAQTPWRNVAARHVVYERMDQQRGGDLCFRGRRKVPVYYDDAVDHQRSLEHLLGPHGFRVALIGKMRCGCPVSTRAMFLLTITARNSCHDATANDKEQSERILFERALKGLANSGYIRCVAKKNMWVCGAVLARCVCLARTPRDCGPEPSSRRGETEQELMLLWSSPQSFQVRRLFFTGPKSFLTHLMLLAHARQYELTHDGLYQRSSGKLMRVELRSEKDIFTVLQLPYVDPLYRYAYCLLHNLL
ncbi:putative DNA polymerase beta thumb [Trypanosoma cruzi]|nr:putative DNA polymerase beta thumb [Trypanosoma cruzi]